MNRMIIGWTAAAAMLGMGKVGPGVQARPTAVPTRGAIERPALDLTGAGSTFDNPAFSKWFYDYAQKTGVRVNYQSIGSGGGIRQLTEGTVDFAASDAPMTDDQISKAKGPVLQLPVVIGALAVTYNVPGVQQQLKLTGDVLADIYLGKITRWNDARLAALNAGVKLPATDILVVHRSDASGTSYIFTDYLSAVSPSWKSGPGKGTDVSWPAGLGGKGNEGVAGQVKQTPGTIGYVELAYAKQNKLPYARMRNAAGVFLEPTLEGTTAAAASAASKLTADTDFRISIVNAPGKDAYPIASFSWILLYKNQSDAVKGKALVDLINWCVTAGQPESATLDYAPLPANVVKIEQAQLKQQVKLPAAQ